MTKNMEFPLGFDNEDNFRKEDLSEINHILISGGSGFGKSNFLDSMILNLATHNKPEKLRFVMCDTKASEFSQYADMEHLLMPIATSLREISMALGMVLLQGQDRLKEFAKNQVKTISSFNDIAWENYEHEMPRIVVVVDDLSSIINPPGTTRNAYSYMAERVEQILSIGRAAGIHLVAVTQTPTKKKMKGIVSRLFSKIIFCSPSMSDTRFLVGKKVKELPQNPGAALFCSGENYEMIHTLLIKASDFCLIHPEPEADLIDKAAEIVIEERVISEAKLQSRLNIGKSQAANILSQLEEIGLVGDMDSSGNRLALVSKEQWAKAMKQLENE